MKRVMLWAAICGLVLMAACTEHTAGQSSDVTTSSEGMLSMIEDVSSANHSGQTVSSETSEGESVPPPLPSEGTVSSAELSSSEGVISSEESEGEMSGMAADTRLQVGDSVIQADIEATVLSIEQNGSEICVTMTITNKLGAGHKINMPLQFHLLDEERQRVKASRMEDMSGADVRAKTIATNETLETKVYFTLPDGYTPITFQYTYDYMGFRSAQYKIW